MITDKLPPQAVEIEEAVLGALMLELDAQQTAIDLIGKPEVFYKPAHGTIFSAIQNLFRNGNPIDLLTVTQELKKMGELEICGGAYYISQLTNRVASSANIEYHCRIIIQKYIQRVVADECAHIQQDCYKETVDIFSLIARVDRLQDRLRSATSKGREAVRIDRLLEVERNDYDHRADSLAKGITPGVPTNITDLTRFTSGWQDSDLIILAGRPAMGKTSFAIGNTKSAAAAKKPVVFFSLEMNALQLVQRLIIDHSEVDSAAYKGARLGNGEIQTIEAARAYFKSLDIFIDDEPGLSVQQVRMRAKRLKQRHDIQMIVVDYLQLMTSEGHHGNREQEISAISRTLKLIAKELNVPVIALSQLSRAVETRGGDKRPQLSDLRESGAIEQDADMVIFLHRPEYYGMTLTAEGESTKGLAEIIVSKHRNGDTGIINAQWIGRLTKFADLHYTPNFIEQNNTATLNPNNDFLTHTSVAPY